MNYGAFQPSLWGSRVPKLESQPLIAAFEAQLQNPLHRLGRIVSKRSTRYALNFKKTAYNWLNYCRELPPCYNSAGRGVEHTKFGQLFFESETDQELGMLIGDGKLMLIYWFAIGDDFDVTRWNFTEFPMSVSQLTREQRLGLRALVSDLEGAMSANVQFKLNAGKRVGNFNLARCRDVTDRSDRLIASAIGFDRLWDDIELYYSQTVRTDFSDDLEEE